MDAANAVAAFDEIERLIDDTTTELDAIDAKRAEMDAFIQDVERELDETYTAAKSKIVTLRARFPAPAPLLFPDPQAGVNTPGGSATPVPAPVPAPAPVAAAPAPAA